MGERLTIPAWKKLMSHVTEIRLEETQSQYHSILAVNLINGRCQLCCEKAIYSFDDKYDNYRLAFERLAFEQYQWKSVLVLGLGLASVPFMLEQIFKQKFHYTAVELDEVVAELSNRYTLSDLDSPVEVVIADAYQYMMNVKETFDIIIMDVFAEDVIPNKFQTPKFLRLLDDHLTDDGVLLYNRMATTVDDLKENNIFLKKFKDAFPKGNFMEVEQNWILYNDSKFFN